MIWVNCKPGDGAKVPERKTAGAAAHDLCVRGRHRLKPHTTTRVPLGAGFEIPDGYAGLLLLRSSVAAEGRVFMPSLGLIDPDFRGEISIVLTTHDEEVWLGDGDRIAQLLIMPAPFSRLLAVEELSPTKRGAGGFGSTGR